MRAARLQKSSSTKSKKIWTDRAGGTNNDGFWNGHVGLGRVSDDRVLGVGDWRRGMDVDDARAWESKPRRVQSTAHNRVQSTTRVGAVSAKSNATRYSQDALCQRRDYQ